MPHNVIPQEKIETIFAPIIAEDYEWPLKPEHYDLEFIMVQGELVMDYLNREAGVFWSEENVGLELPRLKNGQPVTYQRLALMGIPVMC